MMQPHNAFGWGWNGTVTLVLMLAVLTLVIWLVAGLLRPVPPPPDRTGPAAERTAAGPTATERAAAERAVWDRAEEILAERYARGEIDDDEYVRRLGALRTGRGAPMAGAGARAV